MAQTHGTPSSQGQKAPPQSDKSKSEAQGTDKSQKDDHAKKPDMASKDNKSGKPS